MGRHPLGIMSAVIDWESNSLPAEGHGGEGHPLILHGAEQCNASSCPQTRLSRVFPGILGAGLLICSVAGASYTAMRRSTAAPDRAIYREAVSEFQGVVYPDRSVAAKTAGIRMLKDQVDYFVPHFDKKAYRWAPAKVDIDAKTLLSSLEDGDKPQKSLHKCKHLNNRQYLLQWLQDGRIETISELRKVMADARLDDQQDFPNLCLYVYGDFKTLVPQVTSSSSALARIFNLYRRTTYSWEAEGLATAKSRSEGLPPKEAEALNSWWWNAATIYPSGATYGPKSPPYFDMDDVHGDGDPTYGCHKGGGFDTFLDFVQLGIVTQHLPFTVHREVC